MNNYVSITDSFNHTEFNNFLESKMMTSYFDKSEIDSIKNYIDNSTYEAMKMKLLNGTFPDEPATKLIINKAGTSKKRVVYSYSSDINITLKFIAYKLHYFDYLFADNCYSFRHNYGVSNAIRKIKHNKHIKSQFCLKVDIKNYFNSMNIDILLSKLEVIKSTDLILYKLFENILSENHVYYNGKIITEAHGGMAGIPISPFFANIYMSDIDTYFYENNIEYYRYSDDIILFADTYEDLMSLKTILYSKINDLKLEINHEKEYITKPGEVWEFLGFSYCNGEIDLSENSIRKMKQKIKRKSEALRRWQRKKGLPSEKAAIGFINTINNKLYGRNNSNVKSDDFTSDKCSSASLTGISSDTSLDISSKNFADSPLETVEKFSNDFSDFTWSRWFFPNITTTKGLKIIDDYMQEYIRYTITGRHYKGNYRIKYETLKKLGYRNLVNEYYKSRN